jgi:hypothetical protein
MLGCQLNYQYRIPLLSSLCNMIYFQLRYYKRPRLQRQKHKFVAEVRHAFSSSLLRRYDMRFDPRCCVIAYCAVILFIANFY